MHWRRVVLSMSFLISLVGPRAFSESVAITAPQLVGRISSAMLSAISYPWLMFVFVVPMD